LGRLKGRKALRIAVAARSEERRIERREARMLLFALEGATALGGSIAGALGRRLDPHEERRFEDGEHKARPLVSVRGGDVFVVANLAGDADASPNDRLIRLLFFLASCRDNGATRVTAVVPYLSYARKDRQTKRRDPVTTRTVARLFDAVGTDRLVALDVHNVAAFQNAFRCETVHLEARQLFLPRIRALAAGRPICVFSPDGGGVKRAELLRQSAEAATGDAVAFGFMEKRRSRGVVSGSLFAGDVGGAAVFVVDDMIATGGTMARAARACRERGAAAVFAMAAHGLFGPGSDALTAETAIDRIVVTDSAPSALAAASNGRVEIAPVGPLIAEAIGRLHAGEPLGDLTGLED
jgi:ribose-phosphate pyrophosphokinase